MDNLHLKQLQEYASQLKGSSESSKFSGGTQDILTQERANASFKVEEMINLLDGSKENTVRRRFITSSVEKMDFMPRYGMNRQELFADSMKDFIAIHKKFPKFKPEPNDYHYMNAALTPGGSSLGNHMYIFLSTIASQGDDEQASWWFQKAQKFEIIGSYTQTELGHGSNVRGLQTTATYDKQTEEFIMDTPTLQSIKWWPGALGKAATHGVIYAQLIIDGKEYGLNVFMVQIRDENFNPLPGILVGDLGNKMGDAANDTGFLVLNKIRIPRRYMLMRNAQVSPDGKFTRKSVNKLAHYQTMIFTRAAMSRNSGNALAKACTVAARWSAVRKQGFKSNKPDVSFKSEETCILDYKIQQYRILKQISFAYGIKIYGLQISSMMSQYSDQDSDAVKDVSAISAGMKSVLIKYVVEGMEDLRKSCGGAGYLLNSGIGNSASDYLWTITAEGDYVILSLLTGKYLLNSLAKTFKGKEQKNQLKYLNVIMKENFNILEEQPKPATSYEAYYQDLDYLLSWFRYKALVNLTTTSQTYMQCVANSSVEEAQNEISPDLFDSTTAHCLYFLLNLYVDFTKNIQNPGLKKTIQKLCAMFACSNLQDDKWTNILPNNQISLIKQAVRKLMNDLRPDIICLVDAFDIHDSVLASTIGRKDGNVYEALFKAATQSPLNQTDPFKGYEEVLKPHLNKEFLKLRNTLPKI